MIWVSQGCILEEVDLDVVLEATCGAHQAILGVGEGFPFPFFGDMRVGLVDQMAQLGEALAAPVAQPGDAVGDRAKFLEGDLGKPLDFLEDISFDVILSSLVLSYVPDWQPIFEEFFRLLRLFGLLEYSADHPFDDFYRFLDRANYFEVERIKETWRGFGFEVLVPFYRWPLSEVINPLIAAGFLLDKIVEPQPLPEFKDREPADYDRLMKQPGFICIRTKKPPNP